MTVMTVERLAEQYKLFLCVECGKCVAVCPMGKLFDDLTYDATPRGVIEKVLLDFDILDDARLWYCLTCNECTKMCPQGVRFRDFVEAARQLVIETGDTEQGAFCRNCGGYLWPQHTVAYLRQKLGPSAEELELCPKCRQYSAAQKIKGLIPAGRRVPAEARKNGKGGNGTGRKADRAGVGG